MSDIGDILIDVGRVVLPDLVEDWLGFPKQLPPPPPIRYPTYEEPSIQPVPSAGGAGMGQPPINPQTGRPFKNMVWDPNLQKWKKCRRRRRALLTNSDFNALLKIQTLSNSKNIQIALAKAIR